MAGLGDAYQDSTDAAIRQLIAAPPAPPVIEQKKSNFWSALPRGVVAGAAESIASQADAIKGFGQVLGASGAYSGGGMFSTQSEAERADSEAARTDLQVNGIRTNTVVGQSLRAAADEYRPDPVTAGWAENAVFGLSRFLTKAVGYSLATGPVGGAVLTGVDEAMTTADELGQRGVDLDTRMKAGAVAGLAAGAGVILPVSGSTLKATAGLYLAGGPGAFVAQQAATSAILKNANYGDLALRYDPLDPVGLGLSLAVPLPFALHGAARVMRARGSDATTKPEVKTELTQEQVDATMVHNLTLQQDGANLVKADPGAATAIQVARARQHLDSRTDLAPEARAALSERYEAAAAAKPAFDEGMTAVARELGPQVLDVQLPGLKGAQRAVEKMTADLGGDAGRLGDLVRGTIVVRDASAARAAVAALESRFGGLTGLRNTLEPGSAPLSRDGYRDIKGNVLINGQLAEVQVNLPEMVAAKKKAHPLYEEARSMDAMVAREVRDFTPAEAQRRTELRQQQREIYDAAWAKATSSRNLASDTSMPLRSNDADGNRLGSGPSQARTTQSGVQDTGIPSTSAKSVPGGNEAGSRTAGESGFMGTSDAILGDNPANSNSAPAGAPKAEPYVRSVLDRAAALEKVMPDMVVRMDESGNPVTMAEELAALRREAAEGTDAELGAKDASLLQTAADCALTMGSV